MSVEEYGPNDANNPSAILQDITYACQDCNYVFKGDREVHFCSRCGIKLEHQQELEKHILLIDDSALARKKMSAILKTLRCRVEEAENAFQGIVKAREMDPDMIILDVMMPKKDGLQILRELRQEERFKTTPIIMLTVKSDPSTIAEAIKSLATDYIRKDSKTAEIMARLKKHLTD